MSEHLIDSIPDTSATPEEYTLLREEHEELAEALQQLSERDRDLLCYKYNLELSDREIADIMNIPINNIREYLVRAKRRALKVIKGVKPDYVKKSHTNG